MSVEHSQLGKETQYPTQYQPEVLFPISRAESRQQYADVEGITQGKDWWHVFEISWLNQLGLPQVAIGRLTLPASSPNLIESKSLKLYFNSLNFTKFDSKEAFIETVERDLSSAAGAKIELQLFQVDELEISKPQGICIDDLVPERLSEHPDSTLLQLDTTAEDDVEITLHSHLLRSNCPVTGQPDWGTIFIRFQGKKPCYRSLLAYIISYRQHNGFHEQCVEQIFADIWKLLGPQKLMVYATYTRRGGLDINPCRVSDLSWMPEPIRLARQ
ncbi:MULTISPECIES: NADPH-dependent 7-cyano-7-deazaguanine reductase QueF [Acinetobacter]|uniref:NADPH-dependent 7-cyano-7-deazaguanine reductase n=1 Tax=Acinetobacter haemolyticus CIP 64.3 = MTCC 9819 TaxID=1217659 RepID=N9GNB8_ACIHA|nr:MULTISPECIES: NADPH-dependent 7-cyano-7-deazaguanine reductase QueF [Acinetobacter]AZN69378.1 NADPH-dependent 7-cyano-7-deazaguanine reductase QueF [Acinetobacter haemolyticus]EEH68907.1 queuine synthase [Acinetobacter sp. ATCC 27244]ENW18716.1 NADPH-dependent 7-cyano-7-deazaguanine reductase [Acinetobacter haemolyticus CIP 64.3 = MTCC 9819]EPR90505.1 NADPH dependent preQ0 reductase [Acinetobacter haemolyticus CIP 64.3 = MTCC 9819]MCU4379005.1 NADPH-dependent 7-cyano-7-deazaguanine reductas